MSQSGSFSSGGPTPPGSAIETLTGNTGGAVSPTAGNVNVIGDGITISVAGNPGTSTLTISAIAGGVLVESLTGDVGGAVSPTLGNINIITNVSSDNAGSTILFSGDPATSTLTLNVTDVNGNTIFGQSAGNSSISGTLNVGFGSSCLNALTSGIQNTTVGLQSMFDCTTGSSNTVMGCISLKKCTTGTNNSVFGVGNVENLLTGSCNTVLGTVFNLGAGSQYTGAESSNILINHVGVTGDNNVMRLGTSGSGNSQVNKCFIAGIDGVNVGSVARVVTEASDQLGTAVITAGTGIIVTPTANVITISATGTSTLNYIAVSTTPYVVAATDDFMGVNSSGSAIQINLPNAPATGRVYTIKDSTGSAAVHNITVTTVGGIVNIDGATSFVMNTAYESINVLFDGSTYQIF